ncbi:MAG: homogentisate 1,2-dioxygenase [Planctomycetota bacterium]
MPFYQKLGTLPAKRHIAFRKEDGGIYYEELMGNKGFVGPASLLYHIHRPTTVQAMQPLRNVKPQAEADEQLRMRHFRTNGMPTGGSATLDRHTVLFNDDVAISHAAPDRADDFWFRNAQADEIVYVGKGSGRVETVLGDFDYSEGDYIVIPRFILYRLLPDDGVPHRLLVIESRGHVRTPKRYRNEFGQMLEGAPFSERDIRTPDKLEPHDEMGEFRIVVKQHHQLVQFTFDHHPLDVVGWDGYYFPFAFNIANFEPIVGKIHQPPPIHQTFDSDNFVVCSFCPRPYDFHPEAVPAPYHHSNVMSDEVLFYVSKEFMSRKGIEWGSITLHPDGLVHGPHPGRAEASIGQKETHELAVMVDTFRPLHVAKAALAVEDGDYYRSWMEPIRH